MEDNNNVKYNEDEYVFNDDYNENESGILNKSNKDINDKKMSDKEDKKSENQYSKESFLKKADESDDKINIIGSQKLENNSPEINNKNEKSDKSINKEIDQNIINQKEENNFNFEANNDITKEKNNEIKMENNKSKELEKGENQDNKNIYIMKKEGKNSSQSNDSQLMSETQILKMSLNENDKNTNKEENKKEENREEQEEKKVDNKEEHEEKKEENKEEHEEKKEEDKQNTNKIEELKKEESVEIKNKNNNESEHLIDSIIENEIQNLPQEEIVQKREKNEDIIEKEKKYITLHDLKKEPFKEMKIDSPRSLQIIHDSGYTLEELYYNPNNKGNNINEQIRINKIKKLCELRNRLIQEENFEKENNNNNELIKNLIINTQEKILDDQLERIKNKNDIELANIVQYELDKNLSKYELKKSQNDFKKEKLKFKYYENLLKQKNKRPKPKRYKTIPNKTPIITNLKTPNENLKSFYIGKRQNEYSYNKQKLFQKLKKIEIINFKKNEKFKLKKSIEAKRVELNLKKSEEEFNIRLKNLRKKMEWKGLITNVIKNVIRKDQNQKMEYNKQKDLLKKDYINQMRKNEQIEREKKLEILNEKSKKRGDIKNMTQRIYSSRIDRYHTMEKERKNNISKIQSILKNGEGENEKNLDVLMEEFPDNPRIAEVIKDYQIKKNEIQNTKKLRLYSSYGNLCNINTSNTYFKTLPNNNNYMNKSTDKKRIFLYTNMRKEKKIGKKNEEIKTEERRINNLNEAKKSKNDEIIEEIKDIHYEDELREKIRLFKVQLYKKFLTKVKEEKNNEILRRKQLKMIKDETLRNNLEIQFRNERALIDIRLRKENENLQKLAKEYETRLKGKFLKKHDKILNLIRDINEKTIKNDD